jgi:hypothetical protein
MTTTMIDTEAGRFGAVTALEAFKAQLLRDRGRIENEDEPVFDVIVDLLDRCVNAISGAEF